MLDIILTIVFSLGFLAITGTMSVATVFTIIEERKQAKRNEAREAREIEQHKARMAELNNIIGK